MRPINCFLHLGLAFVLAALVPGLAFAQSKDSKNDPDQIGSRDVGTGVNFYSLEKEIALGRQLGRTEITCASRIRKSDCRKKPVTFDRGPGALAGTAGKGDSLCPNEP